MDELKVFRFFIQNKHGLIPGGIETNIPTSIDFWEMEMLSFKM